jgi:hypothetical protein
VEASVKSYAAHALDEIARRRTKRARRAARDAAIRNAETLQQRAAEVVELHREKPYPESPLASRAATPEDELREAIDSGDAAEVQRALEATREVIPAESRAAGAPGCAGNEQATTPMRNGNENGGGGTPATTDRPESEDVEGYRGRP